MEDAVGRSRHRLSNNISWTNSTMILTIRHNRRSILISNSNHIMDEGGAVDIEEEAVVVAATSRNKVAAVLVLVEASIRANALARILGVGDKNRCNYCIMKLLCFVPIL